MILIIVIEGHFPVVRVIDIILILLVHLVRKLMSFHNYEAVHISDLQPGMILSTASSLLFQDQKTTILKISKESMSDRLSEEDISYIYKWVDKHPGYDKVSIVRKLPFSAFISLGFVIFLVLGALKYYEAF